MIDDPLLRLFVETLIKTVTTKTVELSINGISKLLGRAVRDGNQAEAEKIIKAEGIQNDVAQLATEVLSSAYVVPFASAKTATADDQLSLFVEVIKLGCNISKKLEADICVPGSILGENTVSLIGTKGTDILIQVSDRKVTLPFDPKHGFGILFEKDPIEFCDRVKEEAKALRETTTKYLSLFDTYDEKTEVAGFTTRAVIFREQQKSIPIQDWGKGISMMFDYLGKFSDFDTLPPSAGADVFGLSKRLATFYAVSEAKE
jgi:hypothetical protein